MVEGHEGRFLAPQIFLGQKALKLRLWVYFTVPPSPPGAILVHAEPTPAARQGAPSLKEAGFHAGPQAGDSQSSGTEGGSGHLWSPGGPQGGPRASRADGSFPGTRVKAGGLRTAGLGRGLGGPPDPPGSAGLHRGVQAAFPRDQDPPRNSRRRDTSPGLTIAEVPAPGGRVHGPGPSGQHHWTASSGQLLSARARGQTWGGAPCQGMASGPPPATPHHPRSPPSPPSNSCVD